MRGHVLPFLTVLFCSTALAQENMATGPADSMAYYSNTKRPVFSDSALTEFAATIRADGRTMIVQSNTPENLSVYRLFEYQLDEQRKWGTPARLYSNSRDSTSLLMGGPSLSFDGNTLFFFTDNDIYFSSRRRDGWDDPENLGAPVNTSGYEGFPSISADGKTLYFVRQNLEGPKSKELRKEMNFCPCIYRSVKDKSGTWQKPEKLPFPVNQDCEKGPRIMADGKTLIFSSNRPGGKGGYDLYQSQLNDLDRWSKPVPLTYVNTEHDDQSPSISAEGHLMYYTHNSRDIYSVLIPHNLRQFKNNILQGYITDRSNQAGLAVDVIVTDAFTSEEVMHIQNNPDDGRYTVVLPVGRSFNIEFKREGYSSYTHSIDLSNVDKYQELELSLQLFKTVHLELNINDRELFEAIPAEVKIRAKGEPTFLFEGSNHAGSGKLAIDLPLGKEYEIMVSSKGFKTTIVDFNVADLVIYRDFEKFIQLVPEKKEVMINVADLNNNGKVKAKIILKNKDRDEIIEVVGNQMVSLRAGDRYELEVSSDEGYAFDSRTVDLSEGDQSTIDFKLQKLEINTKLTLKDINFESNSATLTDVSYAELARVLKLLDENPTLRVEVAAHTDDVGSDQYNLALSHKRAEAVVEFLRQNNVESTRFVANGYGEKMAKVPNSSEENRLINRRVELKILGI